MENAKEAILFIKQNLSQKSSSKKDEINVMKAIINDQNYSVNSYSRSGEVEEYNPSRDLRNIISNVVSSTTNMPIKEARELVNGYEFTRSDAESLVNVSKEFVNSYLQTGRKLPLGGRDNSYIELMWKNIAERTVEVPNPSSNKRFKTTIPEHGSVKVFSPCPSWISKK